MDDRIAREGTLVRCNADREATAGDIECMNARRAAAAIAAQSEAAERIRRDAASEARLLAARQRYDAQQAAEREAALAAEAEEQRAYEAQWVDEAAGPPAVDVTVQSSGSAPVDGAPALTPITLPRSALPPLTTVDLPAGAKPIDYVPPPRLEEIVVPDRHKLVD